MQKPGNDLKARVEYYEDWDYNIKVAGVKFRQKELDELYEANWNDLSIEIQPEPENKYDPNAIAIYVNRPNTDTMQLGYIPAIVAEALQETIKNGQQFECALIYITNNHAGRAAGKGGKGIRTAKIALRRK